MKKAQGFSKHIILYAKGWYGKSENGIISDIKQLLAAYARIDQVSDHDVWEMLCRAAAKYLPEFSEQSRHEYLMDMLGKKWTGFNEQLNRKPEEVIIGMLSVTDGEVIDPCGLLPVVLFRGLIPDANLSSIQTEDGNENIQRQIATLAD